MDDLQSNREPPPPSPPPPGWMRTAGLVCALIGLVFCWVPYVGFVGTLGVVLALAGYSSADPNRPFPTAPLICGLLATVVAGIWAVLIAIGSCPHVYAFDGNGWRLEADMLSGSFLPAAEGEDLARIDGASPVGGRYLLRVANERRERDHLDLVQLLVVDHAPALTALPTDDGKIVVLGGLRAPTAARDAKGRDLLPALADQDDQTWRGQVEDHDPAAAVEPRDVIELTLPRVASEASRPSYLVLRARNTQVATDALYRYLGEMGPGLGALLRWAEQGASYPYRQRIADELERLGIPLRVEVMTQAGWTPVRAVRPLGPAAMRALAIALPDGLAGDSIQVRFTAAPQFWEVDRVGIAAVAAEPRVQTLSATRAVGASGRAAALLAAAEGDRLLLSPDGQVDLEFAVPASAGSGTARSLFVKMRGYYEVDIGGRAWLNPVALWRHRSGADSLPRYVVRSIRRI